MANVVLGCWPHRMMLGPEAEDYVHDPHSLRAKRASILLDRTVLPVL